MKEFRLETGTLSVSRNAELLSAITYGSIFLTSLSEINLISTLSGLIAIGSLGNALSFQRDLNLLNKNINENNMHNLRNKTIELKNDTLIINYIGNIVSTILNPVLVTSILICEPNIATIGIATTGILSSVCYAKSASMYKQIIAKAKQEKIEKEKTKIIQFK